jgi:hypothetical protein
MALILAFVAAREIECHLWLDRSMKLNNKRQHHYADFMRDKLRICSERLPYTVHAVSTSKFLMLKNSGINT